MSLQTSSYPTNTFIKPSYGGKKGGRMKQSKSSMAKPLTTNKHLIRWVEKMAELTQPAAIHWVDGSQKEYDRLCDEMVASGPFIRLNSGRSGRSCFYARF